MSTKNLETLFWFKHYRFTKKPDSAFFKNDEGWIQFFHDVAP